MYVEQSLLSFLQRPSHHFSFFFIPQYYSYSLAPLKRLHRGLDFDFGNVVAIRNVATWRHFDVNQATYPVYVAYKSNEHLSLVMGKPRS